jgi:outer membrane protein assembly factor BamA
MKFISSLEYRFDLIGSFMGALFVDAGNIWDTRNEELVTEQARFRWLKSLPQMAVGSGVGLRYNLSFLILRSDFGFKTYVPYEEPGKRWFNKNYLTPVINLGINYPF